MESFRNQAVSMEIENAFVTRKIKLMIILFFFFFYVSLLFHSVVFPKDQLTASLPMVSHCSLSASQSPQVSRTLLSILTDHNYAVVWMVSTYPFISKSSYSFTNP